MLRREQSWLTAAARIIGVGACLLLASCLVTPGKFTSTMTINADRTFVFNYKGEVISVDLTDDLERLGQPSPDDASATGTDDEAAPEGAVGVPPVSTFAPMLMPVAAMIPDSPKGAPDGKKSGSRDLDDSSEANATASQVRAKREARNQAMAEALMKQEGFRSVVYRGNNVFDVDYEIRGRLDYSFVFPYNIDANIIAPFLAVEVRKDGLVRMRADGFSGNKSDGGRRPGVSDRADGVFTLITNAPIVSQNNEDGVRQVGRNSVMTWRVTPLRTTSPTVVLKLAPNPLAPAPLATNPAAIGQPVVAAPRR